MEDDLFTFELGVVEDFYFPCVEQSYNEGNLNIYEVRVCHNECEEIYDEAVIQINKRLVRLIDITVKQWLDLKYGDHKMVDKDIKDITNDELSNLEEENMGKGNEIAEIFMIETNIFHFETPLCKAFKEFNYLLLIDVDVLTRDIQDLKRMKIIRTRGSMNGIKMYHGLKKSHVDMLNGPLIIEKKMEVAMKGDEESSDDDWNHYSPIDEWKDYEYITYMETDVNSNLNTYLDFSERELMEDDGNVGDLDDYLLPSNAPYYVNEEEERFKERRCKLLGIPYKKPPTFKSEKFE
ncbi:hypothetical protein Tco_1444777, partial [Tanacetum coccineum]